MSRIYQHNGYTYEWDLIKANRNTEKHKISFELACEIFDDPDILSVKDKSEHYVEDRWLHLGEVAGCIILLVVSTDRANHTRIISARKATSKECKRYRSW